MPGLVSATTDFAELRHKRHYDTYSHGLVCPICNGPMSNGSRLCASYNNSLWLPFRRKLRRLRDEWREKFDEMQVGKVVPSCPCCGQPMHLWYGYIQGRGGGDVVWICRRKIGRFICTAELELEEAEQWRLEMALAAVVKRKPKRPVIVRPPLVDGVPMAKSTNLTVELELGKMTIWTWHNKGHIRGKVLPAGGKRALYVCRADVVAHLKKRLKAKRGRPFKKEIVFAFEKKGKG